MYRSEKEEAVSFIAILFIPCYSYEKYFELNHHLNIIMVLKAFEKSVPLFLAFYDTACIVTVKFSCSRWISKRTEVLFLSHYFFDTGKQSFFISTYEFKSPIGRVFYLWFFLCFIV